MINFKKGITVVEILIVLAILIVLIALILPSFNTMRNSQVLKSTAGEVFLALDKARSQTLSSLNSSEYGVHFESDRVVIFRGKVYSSSDPNNETKLISSPAAISSIDLSEGGSDLYFNRLTGAPDKTGTVTVTLNSVSKIITISATGSASMN